MKHIKTLMQTLNEALLEGLKTSNEIPKSIITSGYQISENQIMVIIGKPFKYSDKSGRNKAESIIRSMGLAADTNVDDFANEYGAKPDDMLCYAMDNKNQSINVWVYGTDIEMIVYK